MSGHQHGRRVALACVQCDEIFTRRTFEVSRSVGGPFCSKACHGASMATGRRRVEVTCSGCGVLFRKVATEFNRPRYQRHFCSAACYRASVDYAALARAGRAVLVRRAAPPAARFLRAQKAGLARARNLSPERLREIAMLGVAARVAKGATRGPGRARRRGLDWVGPLLTREVADG